MNNRTPIRSFVLVTALSTLALTACGPMGNASVDHGMFAGTWTTPNPVVNGYETMDLRVSFAGTKRDGTDGAVSWHLHSIHASNSSAAGCDIDVFFKGSYYAKCGEQPVAPPTDLNGAEVPRGCFDMEFARGWIERKGCASPDQNTPLSDYSVSGPNQGSFDHLGYYRLTSGGLLLEYTTEIEIVHCTPTICPDDPWPPG